MRYVRERAVLEHQRISHRNNVESGPPLPRACLTACPQPEKAAAASAVVDPPKLASRGGENYLHPVQNFRPQPENTNRISRERATSRRRGGRL
jgi:hypothetical protein